MIDECFLTSADMARIYRVSSAMLFMQRFKRDRRKPKEKRLFPDPINKETGKGIAYLWSPGAVRAQLEGGSASKKTKG